MALKILPNSHSIATWCIMVNVSMWCLPTTDHKEWSSKFTVVTEGNPVRYYYRIDKETYTFQRQIPFILQHDVHTNISCTYLSSFSMNQCTVLLYELITKKSYVLSIETSTMFVTLQGKNYTANLYLFLAKYPLYHKENSEKFESKFQCFLEIQLDSWKYL